jgi:hypothetical protein
MGDRTLSTDERRIDDEIAGVETFGEQARTRTGEGFRPQLCER